MKMEGDKVFKGISAKMNNKKEVENMPKKRRRKRRTIWEKMLGA